MNYIGRSIGVKISKGAFHTSRCYSSKNVNQQVKILRKLIGSKQSGSKKRWYPSESNPIQMPTLSSISKTKNEGKNASRRMAVLNKLFMKHITDLLATGEASEDILGKGLEVSRVKITPDFHLVNVYWIAKGTAEDVELEVALNKCSGIIRHELSQLKLMGEVPRIHFVKDKLQESLAEVDSALKKCDFGSDYVKRNFTDQIKSDLNLEASELDYEEDEDEPLPIMRHEVLGLNHKEIMDKIVTKMKKSKDAWEQYSCSQGAPAKLNKPNIEEIQERLKALNEKEEEFKKFLLRRNGRKNTPERKKHLNVQEDYVESLEDELSSYQRDMSDDDYIEERDDYK